MQSRLRVVIAIRNGCKIVRCVMRYELFRVTTQQKTIHTDPNSLDGAKEGALEGLDEGCDDGLTVAARARRSVLHDAPYITVEMRMKEVRRLYSNRIVSVRI